MTPTISLPLLDRARVAAPCPAKWEDMTGDDKIRHCALCNLNVHNFSAMSRNEAEAILARHFNPDGSPIASAGRVCGGFFRRADGTYLLQDCPTGLAALKTAVRRTWLRLAAAIGLIGAAAVAVQGQERAETQRRNRILDVSGKISVSASRSVSLSAAEPFRSAWNWLRPPAPAVRGQVMIPGALLISPPAPPSPAPVEPRS